MANGFFSNVTVVISWYVVEEILSMRAWTLTIFSIRALADGLHKIAVWQPDGSKGCLQADMSAAKDTISRIRVMEEKLKRPYSFCSTYS